MTGLVPGLTLAKTVSVHKVCIRTSTSRRVCTTLLRSLDTPLAPEPRAWSAQRLLRDCQPRSPSRTNHPTYSTTCSQR
ncbi:unnamed protein product [Mycena citricolor]|uniref:Uncharacterized protein n=1 Tax=Mycena citricolor TaxID=2018698 RepID=A0AAD2K8R6_9AGAR|nr:unnamed protein product [Mycena citricolor]